MPVQTAKPIVQDTPFGGPMSTELPKLIVTGTKPAQQFAQNAQQVTQMIEKNNAPSVAPIPTQPQPQTSSQPGAEQKEMFQFMETYSDPYTQMLDKISATSDKATQNLIATIKATKANRMSTINQETDRLKSGLMSLGLSTENINFTPDLVYGQIAQAENARMGKLMELDRNEATALLEAQQAVEEKDFRLLKERMDYIKSIKKSRLDILKENYEIMDYEAKISGIQAGQIYDQLQKINENDKTAFLQQVATQFDIPLAALVKAVNDEKMLREDQTRKLAGGGSGGSGGGYTSQELRKLRQAGIDPSDIVAADNFLYGGYVKLSPTDKQTLLESGFSTQEVGQIESDVNQHGIEAVIQGMSESQADAIRKVYGAEKTEDNKRFLTLSYLENLFSDDQFLAMANESGTKGSKTVKIWKAKEQFIDMIVQYRKAGYTDKEILKMMQ